MYVNVDTDIIKPIQTVQYILLHEQPGIYMIFFGKYWRQMEVLNNTYGNNEKFLNIQDTSVIDVTYILILNMKITNIVYSEIEQ